jgi:type VI secretion system protein ImpL
MANGKALLTALGTVLLFAAVSRMAGSIPGVQGYESWVIQGALVVLGLATAGIVYLHTSVRGRPGGQAAPAPRDADEVGETLKAARERLKASALAGSSRISALPVVLVLGPSGGAKTCTVVHSGMEPELLAGEVERAGAVAPTTGLNAWYAGGTVFLEAGGPVLDDERRWTRLARHLQPSRLAAALGRGSQAPRAAVVCLPCDDLLQPDAAETVAASARTMRTRLAELSRQLGVRLPVYVLFTRADRVPAFAEYVRGLTRDEAQEVLGATFPAADPPSAGLYAEFATRRADDALATLARSLSVAQLDLMPREMREPARGEAYEFPRNVRKLSAAATRFLVELCRPSELHVSPFLRGFYFTGVRMVAAGTPELVPAAPALLAAPQVKLGATSVFDPRRFREAAATPASAAHDGGREVPEWAFVRRVFTDIILRDRVAMTATGGGTRVNAARRAISGAAVAACLAALLGTTVSFRNNRVLLAGALAAARQAHAAPADPAAPADAESLRRLDALRAHAATLAGYERRERPLRLAWGLYTGSRAFPALRSIYFDAFDRQLWARTRPRLAASLATLPEAPTAASEYGTTYDDLKAYLVTTSHPRGSTAEFLAPVLERHWAATGDTDPARRALARRQFAFFGSELPHGNPFTSPADEALVAGSREFLGRFAQVERFYRALLDEADRNAAPVDFAREHPTASAVASAPHVVPGAFTRQGWTWVRGNARAMERLFAREDWVLGPRAVGAADRARLSRELQERYVADYVAHWRTFLDAARVTPFSGPADAAARLGPLSGNDSPVLRILAVASQHTRVDSARVDGIFQPVHHVVPPAQAQQVAAEGTGAYLVALGGLRSALQQAVATPRELRAAPLAQAGQAASQADAEVRRLAQGFRIDGGAGRVGASVQRLLLEPVEGARRAIGTSLASLPTGEPAPPPPAGGDAAAAAGQFCSALRPLQGRYPFRADARQEAAIADLQGVFQPGASALSELEEAARPLVSRQGPRYVARAGAAPQPGSGFLRSLTQASELSRALFGDDGEGPRVVFTLRPHTSTEVPEVTVTVDGKRRRFTRTLASSEAFTWRGEEGGEGRIVVVAGGAQVTVAEAQGPWAVFRLFRGATWAEAGDGRWTVTWRLPGGTPLDADVVFTDRVPVFSSAYLERITCASRITS